MNTDPAVAVGIAAVIAAIVGPIIGVVIASTFTRKEATRQESAALFRQIMEDSQNYRHAFLSQYRFHTDLLSYTDKLNKLLEVIRKSAAATDEESKNIHAEVQALYQAGRQEKENVGERYDRAFREARSLESSLNADVLSLGLLFEEKSKNCGRAIRDLIVMPKVFTYKELPSFEDCQIRLEELIQKISEGLKQIHKSLKASDPLQDY